MFALAMVAMAAITANAADITWDNDAGDNDWFNGTNWDPDVPNINSSFSDNGTVLNGTPTATGNVNIDNGGSLLIDGGAVRWSGRFYSIGNGNGGTLILNSGSITVDYSGFDPTWGFGVGLIGPDGLVQQSGGTFNVINDQADDMSIGRSANGVGLYELSGGTLNAGVINVSRDDNSQGAMEISGGTLNATDLYIGRAGLSNGVVEISGGTVDVGVLVNGSGGTSTLHIIGDDATITSNANGTTLAGFSMFNNFKSTLKLTIDEGISLIDASAGTVGISAPGSGNRTPTLDVEFSVTPEVGDVFDIIRYGTLQDSRWDTFDGVVDSPLGEDTVTLAINYAGGALGDTIQLEVIEVVLPEIPGDFNGDGIVDAGDYTVWRDNEGVLDETTVFAPGSGDGGDVGPSDYTLWRANFGNNYGSLNLGNSGSAVPEPDTFVMLACAAGFEFLDFANVASNHRSC